MNGAIREPRIQFAMYSCCCSNWNLMIAILFDKLIHCQHTHTHTGAWNDQEYLRVFDLIGSGAENPIVSGRRMQARVLNPENIPNIHGSSGILLTFDVSIISFFFFKLHSSKLRKFRSRKNKCKNVGEKWLHYLKGLEILISKLLIDHWLYISINTVIVYCSNTLAFKVFLNDLLLTPLLWLGFLFRSLILWL